ncbi:MAG: FecR family protein, partial [Candidatus Aminicenantales bacterium]
MLKNTAKRRTTVGNRLQLVALASALLVAGPALAQGPGRIRHAEGEVTLQRSGESLSEEASANSPFLPGDRLRTGAYGRAEFQLAGGAFLWLDVRSHLEYGEGADADAAAIGIESGSLQVRTEDDEIAIETPDGRVAIDRDAEVRVDVTAGGTAVAVTRGDARFDWGDDSAGVSDGTRVTFRRGVGPDGEEIVDRSSLDAFGLWVEERQGQRIRGGVSTRYLPAELTSYADEFDSYGSWDEEPSVGYVWRPTVEADWAPYSDGRWVWTSYGYTWVPYEPWGWTVSHYGRWGFSVSRGWYWMPGRRWGPAWVSWAVGGSYVGWCPMDHRDRPIHGRSYRSGRDDWRSWRFVRSRDLADRRGAHRRVDVSRAPDFDGEAVRIVRGPTGRSTSGVRSFRADRPLDNQGVVRRDSSLARREASRRDGVTYRRATPGPTRGGDATVEAPTDRSRADRRRS